MIGSTKKVSDLKFDIPNPELFLSFFLLFSRLEAVWKSDPSCYDWGRQGPRLKAIAEKLNGLNVKEMVSASADVRYLDEIPREFKLVRMSGRTIPLLHTAKAID